MLTVFLVLFFSGFILWYGLGQQKNKKRPPGPFRYPLLGNLPQIAAADPFGFRAYHKLSEQYGDIMSMKVGLQEMVVLSSHEAMKDLLHKDELSSRLWTGFLQDRSMGKNLGIAFGSGENQQVLKQFALRKLREFGFGKRESMESVMALELEEMIKRLKVSAGKNDGKIVMERFFQLTLLNVLWSMLAGTRYSHDDPRLHKLLEVNSAWFQSGNFGAGIVFAFPFLRFLFPQLTGYNDQKRGNRIIYDFLRDMIKTNRAREGYLTDPQSVIDVFLSRIEEEKKSTKNTSADESAFTDEQFMVTCYDFFQAGFETTSNTLAFGMLFMVLNPHVQEKVQKELDDVISKGSIPSMADRDRLPYTRAAVLEVFRLSNILPISGPRFATEDVYYKDYMISKGTAVAVNTYSAMRSKKVWGDPDNFRPERFLDNNGKLNNMDQYMGVAFGVGKRACLGETLAQTTVFMTFTTLLLNFKFEQIPNKPPPTAEPIFGIILSPHPYEIVIKVRE